MGKGKKVRGSEGVEGGKGVKEEGVLDLDICPGGQPSAHGANSAADPTRDGNEYR